MKREPLRIGAGGGPENRFHGSIDDVRIYNRALSPAEAGMLADLTPVTAIAALPEDKRTRGAGRQDPRLLPRARAAGQPRGGPDAADRRPGQARRVLSEPSHRHGDGGDAGAARDAPVDPRDVRQARVKWSRRAAGGAGVVADGVSAESAGPGAVAGRSVESADGARDGEPVLADVLRHRDREDGRGFRIARRGAVASGAARLAGDRVRANRLGRESAAEDDRDERDLPAVLAR